VSKALGSLAIIADKLVKNYVSYERRGFLRKRKKIIKALKGVSFNVKWGEVFGLLGPNGVGKTTTVKILATLLLPDSGKVFIDGVEAFKNLSYVREKIDIMLTVEKGFFLNSLDVKTSYILEHCTGWKENCLRKE